MSEPGEPRVRAARAALGLSQVALAEATGLSRQSIGAIEAGRATPAVDVALRIARVLERSVEELFGLPGAEPALLTEPTAPALEGRVALAQIAGRWVSYRLDGEALRIAADALVRGALLVGAQRAVLPGAQRSVSPGAQRAARVPGAARAQRRSRVETPQSASGSLWVDPVRPLAEVRENLVLMGCALGLGLLADRLNSRPGAGRFLWLSRSSTEALWALGQRQTHVAGVHLVDAKTGEANVADVRRHAGNEALTLITLARWEAGLLTARHNPKGICSAADLGQRGLRCVVREQGSGARRLLDRELARAGLPRALASAAPLQARGHLQVAAAIAMGAADTGVATRDVALAFGLHFVPLTEERYDLVVPRGDASDARLLRLFDMLSSSTFQRELACLGYDVRCSGDRVAELSAA